VDIVIVNWNTGSHLQACLDSVSRVSRAAHEIGRVTVVDNASSDGSADGLDHLTLPLRVIRSDRNLGFAAACNLGALGSTADYLLFLNPDCRLFRETLSTVTRFMGSDAAAELGICGVQLVDRDGKPTVSCSRFPTLRMMFGKMTGLDRLWPGMFPPHHLDAGETWASGVVDEVIGAFFFVRRGVFEALEGFDERYFVYFEEVDFAFRARQRGFGTYFLREAEAFHEGNVSTDQVRAARLYYSLTSRHQFAVRHWPRWQVPVLMALTFGVELPARLCRGVLRREPPELSATLGAYRMLLAHVAGNGSDRAGADRVAPTR
jgi:GT2 family glycosyltransferase